MKDLLAEFRKRRQALGYVHGDSVVVTAEDTPIKFQEMFLRRAEKGQSFHRPYLGCREFAAYFEPVFHDQPLPEQLTRC